MDFQLPELGEGIYEAELVRWLIKPGDVIRRGQGLMEVMTDKATMEVPSPFAGAIDSLAVEEGRQLKVGEVILTYKAADQKSEGGKGREGDGVKKKDVEMYQPGDGAKPGINRNRLAGDGEKKTEGMRGRVGDGACFAGLAGAIELADEDVVVAFFVAIPGDGDFAAAACCGDGGGPAAT